MLIFLCTSLNTATSTEAEYSFIDDPLQSFVLRFTPEMTCPLVAVEVMKTIRIIIEKERILDMLRPEVCSYHCLQNLDKSEEDGTQTEVSVTKNKNLLYFCCKN